jgi:hypothetical protein
MLADLEVSVALLTVILLWHSNTAAWSCMDGYLSGCV